MPGPSPSPFRPFVFEAVKAGKSNAEIIIAIPHINPSTIKTWAAVDRRKLGIPPLTRPGHFAIQVPAELRETFQLHAGNRQKAADLMLRVLAVVARDDLFAAVLDDSPSPNTKAA